MNEKNSDLDQEKEIVASESNTKSNNKEKNKSIIPKLLFVAVVSLAVSFVVSFVVAFMMSNNLHESRSSAFGSQEHEDPTVRRYRAELELNKMEAARDFERAVKRADMIKIEKRSGYVDDVAAWTKDIKDSMPATEASKAFGKIGLAALEDDVITDKEYDELSNQYDQLTKGNKKINLEANLESLAKN